MTRSIKTPVLACVEGDSEEAVLKHIKGIYSRGRTYLTIENGYGGSPDALAIKAIKLARNFDGEIKIMWFDSDRSLSDRWRATLTENGFIILESNPCLEGELFHLLGDNVNFDRSDSERCKKAFQKKYLDSRKCIEVGDCERIFKDIFLSDRFDFNSEVISKLVNIASNNVESSIQSG